MPKTTIRFTQVGDAKRFFEILSNPNFLYFRVEVKSIADEKDYLRKNRRRQRDNTDWNYSILYGDKVVGGIGVKINFHRKYIGEIGYFLDEAFWGKGITTKAVELVEKECFNKMKLTRIEIVMEPKNKASEGVAIKCGYKKEGLMKKAVVGKDGTTQDVFLYAKTI